MPTRTVHCEDALAWLVGQPVLAGCSVFTSLPDVSELSPMTLAEWRRWFVDAARLVLEKTPDDGVAIFYQTDIKVERRWVDKGYLVLRAAEETGHELLWHKIVCRRPAGTATPGRPGYAHLLCLSRNVLADPARATADVLPGLGAMTWSRAMGLDAARAAVRFVRDHTSTRTVVDPFCGVGTALAAANEAGLDAVGVERSRRRARKARALDLAALA
jgi:hypothetical protein